MSEKEQTRTPKETEISWWNRAVSPIVVMFAMLCLALPYAVTVQFAEANEQTKERYYLGQVVNAGKNDGYSKDDAITADDPHFGWTLGDFFIEGFTSVADKDSEVPVLLKNAGDEVSLWFNLSQDINKLNGDDKLSIAQDKNGYDERLGIEKTDFKRGTLIVRYTDYQNKQHEPVIYTDFLTARAEKGADTKVDLFEEGDYEVALDYEISNARIRAFGKNLLPSYTDYRIAFRFSVRNGNSMVFPFDVKTGDELANTAFTENGFVLDFAKSRYLDINVKYAVAHETADDVTEDVRYNRPAKDGNRYVDEGIYIITARNQYTNQTTVKKIYVGTNDVLKVYTATGLPVKTIQAQLSRGLVVARDGSLVSPEELTRKNHNSEADHNNSSDALADEPQADTASEYTLDANQHSIILLSIGVFAALMIVVAGFICFRWKRQRHNAKAIGSGKEHRR
ncbi:hypothetical protein [Bifidobacterium felsineum]|uniref:hypothetical protein n=1 Tax=Bifidobacterium felsineum TaxID=2045440 RepID=UPI001BDD03AF|nr:hypothetical protein [Bifidobacterium felsineum]MBT1164272.1 hypothetical protein [Bifidobacterium felsineum]